MSGCGDFLRKLTLFVMGSLKVSMACMKVGEILLMLIEDPVEVLGCICQRVELLFCQIIS